MGEGRRWIELSIPSAETGVVLFTPDGQEDEQVVMSPGHDCERPGRRSHLLMIGSFFNGSFACDDVGYSCRRLKERGVEFEEEPQKQPWGNHAIFKDPDGNRFVLGSK